MKVNLKGASKNAYNGVKALVELIKEAQENPEYYGGVKELADELYELVVEFQPLAACYTLQESLQGS